jgi:hypothetical protein
MFIYFLFLDTSHIFYAIPLTYRVRNYTEGGIVDDAVTAHPKALTVRRSELITPGMINIQSTCIVLSVK